MWTHFGCGDNTVSISIWKFHLRVIQKRKGAIQKPIDRREKKKQSKRNTQTHKMYIVL